MSKVWFITGTSSGFGWALAERALEAGDRVVATARRPEQLETLVARHPGSCRALALDVIQPEQITQAVRQAEEAFGRLDVVVNNAGYGLVGALEEYDDAQMRHNVEVNLFGPLNVIRAVLPGLRAQGSGHIINMSAVAAFSNGEGFSVYGGAKAALEAASEALRAELRPLGIHVTLVEPGPFRTDFISRSLEHASGHLSDYDATSGKFAALLDKINGRQLGDPAKAAEAILRVVASDNPPLRLVLGKYACDKVRRKLTAVGTELNAWESVGLPTDF